MNFLSSIFGRKRLAEEDFPSEKTLYVQLGWQPKEILYSIQKNFLPDMTYTVEKDQVVHNEKGEISQQIIDCSVNGKKVSGTFDHLKPDQFVDSLNEILSKDLKGKLIELESSSDDYVFVIEPK